CHCMLLPPLLATSLIPPRSPPLPYTTLFRSVFTRTTAIGCYDHGYVVAVERRPRGERLWHFRAGRVVLATGAHERSLPFPGNDRSEEHTSELQSREKLVCRLLLEKKKKQQML